MRHLITFENYKYTKSVYTKDGRDYFFDSDKFSYKVSACDNINEPDYPFVGFKARVLNDEYAFYDMSIITNDDIYQVMNTISDILSYDYSVYKNKGYKFSFIGDKEKSKQRLNLYKRVFGDKWDINYDEDNNQYYLIHK